MTVIAFRSPVTKPLVRSDVAVAQGDRSQFRVTQRFADPDFYWRDIDPVRAALGHRAVDIGDFGCGSPIVAMADGIAWRTWDNAASLPNVPPGTTNALGVVIAHGDDSVDLESAYWHLGGWLIPPGRTAVSAGQPIGLVGNTGLGAVCHCHITLRLNGVLIDPEPHMFGAPLDIGGAAAAGGEANQMFNPPDVLAIRGVTLRVKEAGANFRERQGTTYPVLGTLAPGTLLTATVRVVGQEAAGSIEWWGGWAELDGVVRFGFVHSSTVEVIEATAPSAADADAQRRIGLAATHLADASAAISGAGRAIAAGQEALQG